MSDVRKPAHYQPKYVTGPECIQAMRIIWGDTKVLQHCEMNIFEYLFRYQHKNGVEDLEKIKAYCDIMIGILNDESYVPDTAESTALDDKYADLIRGLCVSATKLCMKRHCDDCPLLDEANDGKRTCVLLKEQSIVHSLGLD